MIFKRTKAGDRSFSRSLCIFPLITKYHVFWFQKVLLSYEAICYYINGYERIQWVLQHIHVGDRVYTADGELL